MMGYAKTNPSPLLQRFVARAEELIAGSVPGTDIVKNK